MGMLFRHDNRVEVCYGRWNRKRASGEIHAGIDVDTLFDKTIHATASGKVEFVGRVYSTRTMEWGWHVRINQFVTPILGQQIKIRHVYAHMDQDPRVSHGIYNGQYIEEGQAIGIMGCSGFEGSWEATEGQGAHVHYQVDLYYGDNFSKQVNVDPAPFCSIPNAVTVTWNEPSFPEYYRYDWWCKDAGHDTNGCPALEHEKDNPSTPNPTNPEDTTAL